MVRFRRIRCERRVFELWSPATVYSAGWCGYLRLRWNIYMYKYLLVFILLNSTNSCKLSDFFRGEVKVGLVILPHTLLSVHQDTSGPSLYSVFYWSIGWKERRLRSEHRDAFDDRASQDTIMIERANSTRKRNTWSPLVQSQASQSHSLNPKAKNSDDCGQR